MHIELIREKYKGNIHTVTLGALKEQGGTRTHTVTVGGDATLPFLFFEGKQPNKAVVAVEIWDIVPTEWNPVLQEIYADVFSNPADWARKAVDLGADMILLRLKGGDPDLGNKTPEQLAEVVKNVLAAVGVPLIVVGCGIDEKDNAVLPVVAEAAAGENLLLGVAKQDNYKSIVAAAQVYKHKVLILGTVDINLCKQLEILITELGLPAENILMDPGTCALGYGIEYTYSVMERGRLEAIGGDERLAMPVVCNVGYEAWRAKEAIAAEKDFPDWGEQSKRAILWEALTATSLLQAGANIMIMRHPEAVRLFKKMWRN
ncbi:CO dehydrogenase/acetyl-CoA synthase subunit delta [Sporomusa acidovorans]|uniref:Corrinoid/iron-sulfur protein small subunit n=1 Tax=Sporomusa acidovorans (strain ATCC 49682 / DSM 3132 / Mol) TaxID=1123286 RepID=A0ABZ3J5A8_SPOA4|nr:CO dehydrogenase/acetyl-CoA synthase subunit delta [Sporomusa acidovorans]OZC23541.1 corrinoid/iron-sulfur protein small subunit [Sporomusa acidovorans DSM 3132]SDF46916.1 acetyl-CoA decarbonylase/synthase delta subunit [Sporomusa acidovorans]